MKVRTKKVRNNGLVAIKHYLLHVIVSFLFLHLITYKIIKFFLQLHLFFHILL